MQIKLKNIFLTNALSFIKWLAISVLIGIIVGAVSIAFHYSIDYATAFFKSHTGLIFLLPVGGIIIVLLYHLCKKDNDRGTNFVLVAVRENSRLQILTAPLIFITSTITHLFGGSSGREGAAIQLGGSIGAQFGRLFKLDEKDNRLITMCGMSAAFAALFGTPITAAVFSMEVISVGVMYYSAIVPCIISAVIGAKLSKICALAPISLKLLNVPEPDFLMMGKVAAFGVLAAMLSVFFCYAMSQTTYLYNKYIPNKYLRIALGGILVILLTLIVGNYDYNGVGTDIIVKAINGEAKYSAFLWKIIFTALTLGAGYKGGEIIPVFFTGATFGNVAGKLLNFSPSLGAGLGLVSLFCGVTNCPMTSIVLGVELYGMDSFWYVCIACAVSYMLSGYRSLYKEQKIIYSKIKPEFIDKKAL